MTGRFTTEQLLLIAEDQGWDLDRPLRPQIEGEDPVEEPEPEPKSPERMFADQLAAAQSEWTTFGGNDRG